MLNQSNKKSGFTLIEVMVAISIFVIVAVIATGALITAQHISQKARAIKLVMDNLNFALDSMALKIRAGGDYECLGTRRDSPPAENDNPSPAQCASASSGGEGLFFYSGGNDKTYVYQINAAGSGLEYWESGLAMSYFVAITRSDLDIQHFKFYVVNGDNDLPGGTGYYWPRVMTSIYGSTMAGGEETKFGVQVTMSGR